MANLAIRGHETRGKEVIEILKMLGGKMLSCLIRGEIIPSNDPLEGYYIDAGGHIDQKSYSCFDDTATVFTLEEFFKKFPYKVGDFVNIPEYESEVRIDAMKWDGFDIQYSVFTDKTEWYYAEELNEYNEPNNEEIMKETNKAIFEGNAQCCNIMNNIIKETMKETEEGVYAYNEINCYHQDFGDKVRIRLGGDFEIKVEDKLTYIVRKKPQYPDTYEDCCGVLGMTYDYPRYTNGINRGI